MIRNYHRTATVVALTLALTAGAAAAASATSNLGFSEPSGPQITSQARLINLEPSRPNTLASTSLCSETCSGGGYRSVNTAATDQTYTGPRSEVVSGGGYGSVNTAATDQTYTGPRSEVVSGGGYKTDSVPATVVRVVAAHSSFDWGDAGIGAGAAVPLIGIGLAGTRAATNSRTSRTRQWRTTGSS